MIPRSLLVIRPEPGASATAARAQALGLEIVKAPLFEAHALPWAVPDGDFDAVAMTSAQAARLGGPDLARLAHLPLWAVGEGTAEAARNAGFADVRVAGGDAAGLFAALASVGRVLWLAGRERMPVPDGAGEVVAVPVYAADAVAGLPESARDALRAGALALLHSARAARVLTALAERDGIDLADNEAVAISAVAAEAAGGGWRAVHVAPERTDAAMLEVAARLCNNRER